MFDKYFNKVTASDKAQFLEYFASMLEAGLTVSDVLRAF
jgi:pilus assembly protein TadC